METRQTDRVSMVLLAVAAIVVAVWPVIRVMAQSQEYINGSTAMQIAALGIRIDKIESMINAVLLAMVINFIAQIVQIKRSSGGRRMQK